MNDFVLQHSKLAIRLTFVGISLLLLSACNGGGGGDDASSSSGSSDAEAPSISLVSPEYNRATTNGTIEVVVSASDNDVVSTVTVNGEPASPMDDTTWSAQLPLSEDQDSITVEAVDSAGNRQSQVFSRVLKRLPSFDYKIDNLMLSDSEIILADGSEDRLVRFPLSSLEPTEITQSQNASLVLNTRPLAELDESNESVIAIGQQRAARGTQAVIVEVDLSNGDIEALSQLDAIEGLLVFDLVTLNSNGNISSYALTNIPNSRSGAQIVRFDHNAVQSEVILINDSQLIYPSSMSFLGNAFIILDQDRVFSVDTDGSNLREVSAREQSGVTISLAVDVDIDETRENLWITDQASNAIVSVSLDDGSRRVVSGTGIGTGPEFSSVSEIVFSEANNRAFVLDQALNLVFSVNADTGNREYFISNRQGSGERLANPQYITQGPDGTVFISAPEHKQIYQVDLNGGEREPFVIGDEIAAGQISWNEGFSDEIWAIDVERYTVERFNIETRNVSNVPMQLTPSQPKIDRPTGVLYSRSLDRLVTSDILSDSVQAVAVGSSSSDVSTLSTANITVGNVRLAKPIALAEDTSNNKIYVLDSLIKALVEIDLSNNISKIISSSTKGSGTNLSRPFDLAIDESRQRAYVSDQTGNRIIEIDLSSGNRSVLSDNTRGEGVEFLKLAGLTFQAETGLIYALDEDSGSLVSVDPVSGDRSIVSR